VAKKAARRMPRNQTKNAVPSANRNPPTKMLVESSSKYSRISNAVASLPGEALSMTKTPMIQSATARTPVRAIHRSKRAAIGPGV
jgi:hypothetical protein